MKALKIILYILLATSLVGFGNAFFKEYHRLSDESEARGEAMEEAVFDNKPSSLTSEDQEMDEGYDSSDGSPTSPSEESEQEDEPSEPLDASELADSAEDQGLDSASDTQESANPKSPPNRIGWYLGWFVLSALGLGIMVAWDVIQASAKKSVDLIYNDDGGGTEGYDLYEKAEAAWARGTFIEAIDLLRSYLEINPLQQHAAIRIAEIYEKDLLNYLAAAMEYEEILKQRLAPERWAWMAVHLSNLYSGRLNQPEKAIALLRDLVERHPDTAAATKAAKRLKMIDEAS